MAGLYEVLNLTALEYIPGIASTFQSGYAHRHRCVQREQMRVLQVL